MSQINCKTEKAESAEECEWNVVVEKKDGMKVRDGVGIVRKGQGRGRRESTVYRAT